MYPGRVVSQVRTTSMLVRAGMKDSKEAEGWALLGNNSIECCPLGERRTEILMSQCVVLSAVKDARVLKAWAGIHKTC